MTCSCNIIITFTRLQPLHMCDSQLFMCTDDCALHLLFMLTVGLPSRINADGENCRGRWEQKQNHSLTDTRKLNGLRRSRLLPFRGGASVLGKAFNLWFEVKNYVQLIRVRALLKDAGRLSLSTPACNHTEQQWVSAELLSSRSSRSRRAESVYLSYK